MKDKTRQYIREYQWSQIFAMMRNNCKQPKICPDSFDGKLVVITGATSGIGLSTAYKYAARGANLLCINRNRHKSEALCRDLELRYKVSCKHLIADLSEINETKSVSRELAQIKEPIDVLIHNAGIYLTRQEFSSEGFDKVLVVHYLSPFIINYLLLKKLQAQDKARIIMVGSEGHRFAVWGLDVEDLNWEKRRYTGLGSYGSAKTAQLLAMLCFQVLYQGSGITINTMHPGAVKTDTGQENGRLYRWFKQNLFDKTLKSPDLSAEALYYLGVSQDLEGISGKFFNLTTPEHPAPPALDREIAVKLWEETLKMTTLTPC